MPAGADLNVRLVAAPVALLLGLAAAGLIVVLVPEAPGPTFQTDELAGTASEGTPARLEREFKLQVDARSTTETLADKDLETLQQTVYEAMDEDLASPEWAAPRVVGSRYEITRDPTPLVMRDLYLDTGDSLLFDLAIAYRLRYRFETAQQLRDHEAAGSVRRNFPYRFEVQAKTDRRELGDGFSTVNEARFEFRVASSPFSPGNPPPPPPWPPEEYLPVAQTGRYRDTVTTAGELLARSLRENGLEGDLRLDVALVLISSRTRMHLTLPTSYGSGPNPDQAFIISIDRTDVYEGPGYLDFLELSSYRRTPRPVAIGSFVELEIEFERNTSTRIDELIEEEDDPGARLARDAFLADQLRIRRIITSALERLDVTVSAGDRSKYQRAQQMLGR